MTQCRRVSHRLCYRWRAGSFIIAVAVSTFAVLSAPTVLACGYHNPEAVARGLLNLTYPKALYVRTAIWQAENAGVLPPREQRRTRDLLVYHRMVSQLAALNARVSVAADGDNAKVSFAAVLIDTMLWVRFAPGADGYAMHVHADGPGGRDVVVVTHSKVIAALSSGRLNAGQAERYGLLRLYGSQDAQQAARNILLVATAHRSAVKR
jgi:hypothetical protein